MTDIDASIACDHMMLCAQNLGLSSCWITYFRPDVVRHEFNISDELIPVNILAIGYSAESPKSPDRYKNDRNSLADIVTYTAY